LRNMHTYQSPRAPVIRNCLKRPSVSAHHVLLREQLPFATRATVLASSRRPGLRLAFCLGGNSKRPATPLTLLLRIERRNGALYMDWISGAVVVPVKRLTVLPGVQGRSRGMVELLQIALFHITDWRVHQEAEVGCAGAPGIN
jgi:hypothetical protein